MNWWQRRQSEEGSRERIAVAPSLLSADFSRLGEEIDAVEKAGADMLHIDIMDGHFVPNLTFGPVLVSAIRKLASVALDAHLMIEHPEKLIPRFLDSGVDVVTIHAEASRNIERDLELIRSRGRKCGLALNPDTPFERVEDYLPEIDLFLVMSVNPGFSGQKFIDAVLGKIEKAREVREDKRLEFILEVDGGINPETATLARASGVDVLVAGMAVFGSSSYKRAISELRGVP